MVEERDLEWFVFVVEVRGLRGLVVVELVRGLKGLPWVWEEEEVLRGVLGEAETLGRLEDFVRLGDPDANMTRKQKKVFEGSECERHVFVELQAGTGTGASRK